MGKQRLLVAVSSPPYTIGAVDGLLTVLGAKPKLGWDVTVYLVGDGVYLAMKGQNALKGVYVTYAGRHGVPHQEVNFEKAVARLLSEGVGVHADGKSCRDRGLAREDLVEGVAVSDMGLLAHEALNSKAFFYF